MLLVLQTLLQHAIYISPQRSSFITHLHGCKYINCVCLNCQVHTSNILPFISFNVVTPWGHMAQGFRIGPIVLLMHWAQRQVIQLLLEINEETSEAETKSDSEYSRQDICVCFSQIKLRFTPSSLKTCSGFQKGSKNQMNHLQKSDN